MAVPTPRTLFARYSRHSLPAAALAAGGIITAAMGVPSQAMDILTTWMPDANVQAGQTDKAGDRKQAQILLRNEHGFLVGFNTGLLTPQGLSLTNNKVELRDTGFATFIAGKEFKQGFEGPSFAAYTYAGVIHCGTTDVWQKVVTFAHNGKARTSDPSSGCVPYAGVSGRVDQSLRLLSVSEDLHLDMTGSAFTHVNTMTVSGGLGAFVSLNYGGDNTGFTPNLPGMPLQASTAKASLYTGLTLEGMAYDRTTHALGTNLLRATVSFGAALQWKNFTLGAEYQNPLTDETRNGYRKPVDRGIVFVNAKF